MVAKGILLMLTSSCLFGLLYYYPVLLTPLTTTEFFSWRLIFSCPAIVLLFTTQHRWKSVGQLIGRLKKQPLLILGILFTTLILTGEMFLFAWAPTHNRALSTSLGYLILPIVLVATGKFLYKDRLNRLQTVAVLLGVFGVIVEIVMTRAFSWDTAFVFIGYLFYFVTRKSLKLDGIEAFFIEITLISLGCSIYLFFYYPTPLAIYYHYPKFIVLIPLLGVITASAFGVYFTASRLLPFTLFGLLSYMEPLLLVLISVFLLHETISSENMLAYALFLLAMLFLLFDGIIFSLRNFRQRRRTALKIE